MSRGFLIAAPHSGSGKTTVTLGLIRALRDRGMVVTSAKAGPDFIDPAFHSHAGGHACTNLDCWAMRPTLLQNLARPTTPRDLFIVEGMMGLFDGAADGTGSAADLADLLGLSVILVVDAARQSHSIAALVRGFRDHRSELMIAGVILNRVGSERHEKMLRSALEAVEVPVLGSVPRDEGLKLPSRHLGLVQAGEHRELEAFVAGAAAVMADNVDLDAVAALRTQRAGLKASGQAVSPVRLKPPGQRIAIAKDQAFSFSYPHLLDGWREQGAQICFFSPLADEAPPETSDAIYLPGGYPELHGAALADSRKFLNGLGRSAEQGALIYGECGGYMVLGEALVDGAGQRHNMANLLPLVTTFENRKLHLGYRLANPVSSLPFAPEGVVLSAHEFHYSTVVSAGNAEPLFEVRDALGTDLGRCGMRIGNVLGSYMHLIDFRDDT